MANPYRILVVDDSRDAAYALKMLLTKIGHQVEIAGDGKEGLLAAKQAPPDIVFCDISMPRMNGYEVAEELRADATTRHAYLVALTGYGQDDDRRKALESGFDLHLVKPVGWTTLQETIAAIGERRQGRT
ncbi:MAG TPA: response regulator [Pirellulales bacterium]|jgi:CheY-like chemotaxis protein|nr:response regulator [Pirellulales bacterium]